MVVLGIDVGTSAVKAALSSGASSRVAYVSEKAAPSAGIIDTDAAFQAVREAVQALPEAERESVSCVQVTGQMHGLVLWDGDDMEKTSSCYTWEYRRLDQPAHAALKTQLQAASPSPLYAGYGCSTLVLLAQDALGTSPPHQLLPHAGGLPEYVTSRLINKPSPSMGPSMAAAWGFLAARDQAPAWDTEALRRALKDQPDELADLVISRLPLLVPAGTCLGTLAKHVADPLGLPAHIPVLAAVGDNQAQVAAQAKADLDGPVTIPALSALATGFEMPAFLNVGTSAQLTILVPQESDTQVFGGMVERRPFVAGVDLLVVASLNGGNVLRALAAFCCTPQSDAAPQGQQPLSDEKRAMCRLERLPYVPHSRFPHLECSPRLFGERGAEEDRFAIAGIDAAALACPGALESALCRGLISNMSSHIPPGLNRRITVAYGGGQATTLPCLRGAIEEVLQCRVLSAGASAAEGAYLLGSAFVQHDLS